MGFLFGFPITLLQNAVLLNSCISGGYFQTVINRYFLNPGLFIKDTKKIIIDENIITDYYMY